MNPTDKATALYMMYLQRLCTTSIYGQHMYKNISKEFAIMAARQVQSAIQQNIDDIEYWQEVINEIDKL